MIGVEVAQQDVKAIVIVVVIVRVSVHVRETKTPE